MNDIKPLYRKQTGQWNINCVHIARKTMKLKLLFSCNEKREMIESFIARSARTFSTFLPSQITTLSFTCQ